MVIRSAEPSAQITGSLKQSDEERGAAL